MKTSKAEKRPHHSKAWIERKRDLRRVVSFPEVKGRVLENLQFSTASDHHWVVLDFEDQTSLTLVIDPCFIVSANLSGISNGSQQILRRWPKVKSMTYEG
jgi:hypothetical protein